MENEEHVISIGEIFRVIFKRVWWVIGVTAAFLLIFVFVVQFWYNKNNQTYTVGYEIYFPGMNDGYYPDGMQYRLDNVTSVETLTEIRESNKEFDGINVEEMVEKDEISINKVAVTAEDSATGVAQSYITLTVSAKYFKDNDQAAAFIRAVAAYPVTHALEIVETLKHDDSLVIYDANYTDTFDKKINLLTEQRSYILSMYDSMISTVTTNGSSYMVNGKTLAQYRAEAAAIFDGDDQNDVNYQLDINHYVLDYETFRNSVDVKIKSLEKTIQNNNNIITAAKAERDELIKDLQDSGQTSITVEIAPFNNIIAEYTETNAKLTNQIYELGETKGWLEGKEDAQIQADVNSFLAVLDGFKDELNVATTTFTTVYKQFYNETCTVSFRSNKIEAEGGINIILAALIGAVIGFVIVSIVIYIVDMPKYRRQKAAALESAQKPEETPSQEPEADENK